MARQWPKRPEVPFCYKECNAKTTRGRDTDKCAGVMQRYAPDTLAKHWPLDLPYIIKSSGV